MRVIAWLLCTLASTLTVRANVEKTIFLGPPPVRLPHVRPSLEHLYLDILEPANSSILATQLSVQFPTPAAPHGLESWYIVRGLEPDRRYEVRVCWPAFVSVILFPYAYLYSFVWLAFGQHAAALRLCLHTDRTSNPPTSGCIVLQLLRSTAHRHCYLHSLDSASSNSRSPCRR